MSTIVEVAQDTGASTAQAEAGPVSGGGAKVLPMEVKKTQKRKPGDVAETSVRKASMAGRLNKKAILYALVAFAGVVMVGMLVKPEPGKKVAKTTTAQATTSQPNFEGELKDAQKGNEAIKAASATPPPTATTPAPGASGIRKPAGGTATPPMPPTAPARATTPATPARTAQGPVKPEKAVPMAAIPMGNAELTLSDDAARKSALTVGAPGAMSVPMNKAPFYGADAPATFGSTGNGQTPTMAQQYKEWNGQQAKQAFTGTPAKASAAQTLLHEGNTILAGTIIPAALVTGINTDLPGDILAVVTETIYDSVTGKNILIPQGSKILAKYNSGVTWGQSRVQIVWERLIRPDGVSIDLGAMNGVDSKGYAGTKGGVNEHPLRVAGGVGLMVALSLIEGQAAYSAKTLLPAGADVVKTATDEIGSIGASYVDRALSVQPTITVSAGTKIQVFVNADLLLPWATDPGTPTKYVRTGGGK